MRNFPQQAQAVLECYKERGDLALKALVEGDWESARHLLRLRKAAFHNFRVLEEEARRAGIELEEQVTLRDVAQQALATDRELIQVLESTRDSTSGEIAKILSLRGKIGRYKSGNPILSKRLEQSV